MGTLHIVQTKKHGLELFWLYFGDTKLYSFLSREMAMTRLNQLDYRINMLRNKQVGDNK